MLFKNCLEMVKINSDLATVPKDFFLSSASCHYYKSECSIYLSQGHDNALRELLDYIPVAIIVTLDTAEQVRYILYMLCIT